MSTPIGKLRNLLYLIQFQNQVSDGYGGYTIGSTATKRTFWGDITEQSGNRIIDAGQQVVSRTYKIVARYSKDSPIENGNYIVYEGKVLVITNNIRTDNNRFIEVEATQREVGNDVAASLPGSYQVLEYTAEGGSEQITIEGLINKDVLIVFEEGFAMQVISGLPGRLQVQYVASTGVIKFDHLLQAGERIQIMFQ